MEAERLGRVMGSDLHLLVVGSGSQTDSLADRALARLAELEQCWSRFLTTSEISTLNSANGRPVEVSGDTAELVERSIEAWRATDGLFDPTLLQAVVAAGYDQPFDEMPADRSMTVRQPLSPLFSPGDITIDRIDGGRAMIRFPFGVGFDPGGLGKGLAADIVAAELMTSGALGVLVGVGGDVRVEGIGPDGEPWTVSIDHPDYSEPVALVGLASGAVATSTTLKRRWSLNGRPAHHLIDPATLRPSTSPVVFASVIADRGWRAEAMAKAALLGGQPVANPGLETVLVDTNGRVSSSETFTRFTGGQRLPTTLGSREPQLEDLLQRKETHV